MASAYRVKGSSGLAWTNVRKASSRCSGVIEPGYIHESGPWVHGARCYAPIVAVPYPDITGALLAGGRATRMGGVAKGLLRLEGRTLVARSLELFGSMLAGSMLVVAEPGPYAGLEVRTVLDRLPGRGAPGGLHAALTAVPTPWLFAAGCDMPFLSAGGIALLAARRAGALAVVPRWGGRLQPLHALWSRQALPALERALAEGTPSLQRLAEMVGAVVVEPEAWRAVDPAGLAFQNANTPEEAARLGLSS
jgi:molybdopterin-guanine dinucleotide biosynthesis protein A